MEDKEVGVKCVRSEFLAGLAVANRVIHLIDGVEYPIVNGDSLLALYTVVMILITAYESKNTLKETLEYTKWVTDLFLLAGILAFVPILIRLLGHIPF